MKAILYCILMSLTLFFFTEKAQAQAIRPCITIDGHNAMPATASGSPDYFYKCPGQEVNLAVKNCGTQIVNPLTYSWKSPSGFIYSSVTAPASSPGIWIVTVTYNGPSGTGTFKDTLQLYNYTLPAFSVVTDPAGDPVSSHCSYTPVKLKATVDNQIISTSYKWFIHPNNDRDSSGTVQGTGSTFSKIILTDQNITVTAKDAHGCHLDATIFSYVTPTPPAPDLGPDVYKCSEKVYTLLSTTGDPNNIYTWKGAADSIGKKTHIVSGAGQFWVSVRTQAIGSCSNADTINIYDYPSPIVSLGKPDTNICYHLNGPLKADAKGTGTLTYAWTPSTYLSNATITNPIINFASAPVNTYAISVKVTDGNSCTATATKNVIHVGQGSNPYLFVTANPIDICEGSTKVLQTKDSITYYSSSLSYVWSPSTYLSSATGPNPTVNMTGAALNTPTNYTLSVTDDKGCVLVVNTSATLIPKVVTAVTFADTSICLGKYIDFSASAAGGTGTLAYSWSPATDLNNASISSPRATPTENRLYTVTVTDTKGCSDSKTISLKAVKVLVDLGSDDTSGYSSEPMVLDPMVNSPSYTYVWKNKTTSTALGTAKAQAVTEDATYIVIATDPASGCYAGDSITVHFQQGNPRMIYVPNVVNPTSQNLENKTVKVYATAVLEDDFTFKIFNKWGEMIYETSSFSDANSKGWNGVYKSDGGVEQNLAVFTYSLHGRYFDGQEFDKTGSITLMR